jgi:hypothetical protein
MATIKQIRANRRNAQKATGPKTPEGKERTRFNALVQGLRAESAVIPGEDQARFDHSSNASTPPGSPRTTRRRTEELQPARVGRLPWPPSLPERVRAVRDYLMQVHAPVPPGTVARTFTRARVPDITAILETLAALGQARRDDSGYRA